MIRIPDIYDISNVLCDVKPIIMEAYETGLPNGFFSSDPIEARKRVGAINLLTNAGVLKDTKVSEAFRDLLDNLFSGRASRELTDKDCFSIASQHEKWLNKDASNSFVIAAYNVGT